MPAVPVVFEHQDFIIVLKPTSVTMHRADGNASILALLHQQGYEDLFLVHRLDAATSGLLILAKHQAAATVLSSMFQERQIEKYYLALSDKKPIKKQGHILGDMKNIRSGNYALTRDQSNPAYTQFLSQLVNLGSGQPPRLFVLKPFTGKTHQLRVALKSLGSPILGDQRYAKSEADRMYLHAWALKFKYLDKAYQFAVMPTEGALFQSPEFQQHPLLQPMPWTLKWPSPKAGFRTNV